MSESNVIIAPGATIFVTGVNGLIGSHIVDELLQRGYNVRGAVRDVERCSWLHEYFSGRHPGSLSLVSVPDMTIPGCYDEAVQGEIPNFSRAFHSHSPSSRGNHRTNAPDSPRTPFDRIITQAHRESFIPRLRYLALIRKLRFLSVPSRR